MQSKNWGAFLCDCRSTLNVNQEKIGGSLPLLKVATNPEEEIQIFAGPLLKCNKNILKQLIYLQKS